MQRVCPKCNGITKGAGLTCVYCGKSLRYVLPVEDTPVYSQMMSMGRYGQVSTPVEPEKPECIKSVDNTAERETDVKELPSERETRIKILTEQLDDMTIPETRRRLIKKEILILHKELLDELSGCEDEENTDDYADDPSDFTAKMAILQAETKALQKEEDRLYDGLMSRLTEVSEDM